MRQQLVGCDPHQDMGRNTFQASERACGWISATMEALSESEPYLTHDWMMREAVGDAATFVMWPLIRRKICPTNCCRVSFGVSCRLSCSQREMASCDTNPKTKSGQTRRREGNCSWHHNVQGHSRRLSPRRPIVCTRLSLRTPLAFLRAVHFCSCCSSCDVGCSGFLLPAASMKPSCMPDYGYIARTRQDELIATANIPRQKHLDCFRVGIDGFAFVC